MPRLHLHLFIDFAAKLLQYACTPDPEKPAFSSISDYDWDVVAESDELGKFLDEAGLHQGQAKLERLLRRDGFDMIGDLADLRTANVEVYIKKGIPHLNIKKVSEQAHALRGPNRYLSYTHTTTTHAVHRWTCSYL